MWLLELVIYIVVKLAHCALSAVLIATTTFLSKEEINGMPTSPPIAQATITSTHCGRGLSRS